MSDDDKISATLGRIEILLTLIATQNQNSTTMLSTLNLHLADDKEAGFAGYAKMLKEQLVGQKAVLMHVLEGLKKRRQESHDAKSAEESALLGEDRDVATRYSQLVLGRT